MAALIKPSGHLMTLMFPLGTHTDGPPFAVSFETFTELLGMNFECVHGPVVSAKTVAARRGREQVAVWRRKQ